MGFTLTRYLALSALVASAVVYHAFATRQYFYRSTIYLSSSKVAVAAMGNLAFALALCTHKLVIKVFLGSLRDIEQEMIRERLSSAVMESLLALTIFREEFSTFFVAMFASLVFIKVMHWLVQDRVDYVEVTPNVSLLGHARIVSFMVLLLVLDAAFLQYTIAGTIQHSGQSVLLLFAFEYVILASTIVRYALKYGMSMADLAMDGTWAGKGTAVFYLELISDLLHLFVYTTFFGIVFMHYGLPLHLVRDLYHTFRNFRSRMQDFLRFRQVTARLDRFPDASADDLRRCDGVCIICREEMAEAGANKRLFCGHVFHLHCLRSWLERQQNCPTCRASVFRRPAPPPPQQQAAPVPAQADAVHVGAAPVPPAGAARVGVAQDAAQAVHHAEPGRAAAGGLLRHRHAFGAGGAPAAGGAASPTAQTQPQTVGAAARASEGAAASGVAAPRTAAATSTCQPAQPACTGQPAFCDDSRSNPLQLLVDLQALRLEEQRLLQRAALMRRSQARAGQGPAAATASDSRISAASAAMTGAIRDLRQLRGRIRAKEAEISGRQGLGGAAGGAIHVPASAAGAPLAALPSWPSHSISAMPLPIMVPAFVPVPLALLPTAAGCSVQAASSASGAGASAATASLSSGILAPPQQHYHLATTAAAAAAAAAAASLSFYLPATGGALCTPQEAVLPAAAGYGSAAPGAQPSGSAMAPVANAGDSSLDIPSKLAGDQAAHATIGVPGKETDTDGAKEGARSGQPSQAHGKSQGGAEDTIASVPVPTADDGTGGSSGLDSEAGGADAVGGDHTGEEDPQEALRRARLSRFA